MSQHVTVSVWQHGAQVTSAQVLWPEGMTLPDPEQKDVLVIGEKELWMAVTGRFFFMKKGESRVMLSVTPSSATTSREEAYAALRESFFFQ